MIKKNKNDMNKIMIALLIITGSMACNEKTVKGKFTVNGELKNAADQKIYLEQLFFNQKDPEVLDTGTIKNGVFAVSAIGNEEGLYRLRLEKQEAGYIFINDNTVIKFKADVTDNSLNGPDFNTVANHSFKKFLTSINDRQSELNNLSKAIDSMKSNKASDSLVAISVKQLNANAKGFKDFIVKNIDTLSDPVVAMFALGYTRGIDPAELKTIVPALAKKFAAHQGIAGIIAEYNKMMAKKDDPAQTPADANTASSNKPGIGMMAPEIIMNDTAGKPFALSSLKGKYVLVDFWASWCAPCRGENPNVVANYNKFKNKNFTILGVSLDEDRAAWTKAIKKDGLAWKQVSDLKGWSNAAVNVYGFNGIPYNVLIDPSGKIIATELREAALGSTLAAVLP